MERQYRILLLEDEPSLRKALTLSLVRQGYRVIAAGSPEGSETVLRVVGWNWPDLVLSDANLCRDPDILLGYMFYAWWQARFPVPPFVFMSGHFRFVDLPGKEHSRICHILKPFAPSDLLLLIRAILAE
jgi:DNA-binding response OmpR family regulator